MNSDQQQVNASPPPKGTIWLLPSILTTVSLFSGFYGIVSAIKGHFLHAAVAVIISGLFDGLDGRVARMTRTSSHFGMEYDSLCDLVAFGVAPSIIAYLYSLKDFGRYGWLAAFLYVATTTLRLARFNTQDTTSAKKSFTGLPCPAAAAMVATFIMFCGFFSASESVKGLTMLALVYALSYLMVSSFRYMSFKHHETAKAKAFQVLVIMVLVIMVLATEPQITLFFLCLIYALSGPFGALYRLFHRHGQEEESPEVIR